jgi:tetratricopeptide (TPR) repeat protein
VNEFPVSEVTMIKGPSAADDSKTTRLAATLPGALVLAVVLTGPLRAHDKPEATDPPVPLEVGSEVVLTEPGTMLRDGPRQLSNQGERIFRIERLDRQFADISTEDRTVRGWVEVDQILPLDKAIGHFSERIAQNPKDAQAYQARAQIWIEKEEWDRALSDLDTAIRVVQDDHKASKSDRALAVALRDRGLVWDAKRFFDKAFADLTEAIRIDPDNLGLVLARGRVCSRRGRFNQAIADIDWYIQMRPKDPVGHAARGEALMENLESEAAIAEFTKAVEVDPTYEPALLLRAQTWRRRRDFARTIDDYAEATRRAPDDPEGHRAIAWILATCIRPEHRDGPRAVREATTACELTQWKNIDCLSALAAACAEAGDFSSAAKWQGRLIQLLKKGDTSRSLCEARLSMYQAGKPYRD